ncbi:MAG: ABC transporter ATP-binding protein [Candidatus Omnitrophica bacterium]|nr:ABC transporter ATP-binding protein [Candidatus Omnitrophota bacterium]MBU4140788.1 ABC transporter ATP-binding protein [Candidatus Omnitrophota bacterium]
MIEIINLCKSLDEQRVLKNLNLTIEKGETCVIIGRSGCGKTVLLKTIVGLLKPDSGQVIIENHDITRVDERELNRLRLRIGLLFQSSALFDSLSVGENVGFVLREHSDLDEAAVAKRVKESLELVGLEGVEEQLPAELSGGMKKRVGLARAICARPDIILYDEPTTGVDPIMADAINTLIRRLHDKLEVTSIAVTHDMVSAYKIADRISMLYDGRIIESGTSEEIKNSKDPIVQQFITGAAQGPITG